VVVGSCIAHPWQMRLLTLLLLLVLLLLLQERRMGTAKVSERCCPRSKKKAKILLEKWWKMESPCRVLSLAVRTSVKEEGIQVRLKTMEMMMMMMAMLEVVAMDRSNIIGVALRKAVRQRLPPVRVRVTLISTE